MLLGASRGSGLTDLLAQRFTRVANSLVLVRIGWPERAHVRRHLSQQLAVAAREGERRQVCRRLVDFQIDAVRKIEFDRVRITQGESSYSSLHLTAITDAENRELPRESRRDTLYGVRGQC